MENTKEHSKRMSNREDIAEIGKISLSFGLPEFVLAFHEKKKI